MVAFPLGGAGLSEFGGAVVGVEAALEVSGVDLSVMFGADADGFFDVGGAAVGPGLVAVVSFALRRGYAPVATAPYRAVGRIRGWRSRGLCW